MEMINSYPIVIPFKYLVFSLEFFRVLDKIVLILGFTLSLKLVDSICLI
jgi:hypothetical protein